jgi:hypothetical protein
MTRLSQILLILSACLGSWLGMQAVHEFGHVAGAWLTGGRVSRVVLSPLTISRTDLADNPHPLAVVWAGPLLGCALPLAGWAGMAAGRIRYTFLVRFFAGFCLVANGCYIGCGSFDQIGDCGEMLRHGSALWQLWLFGIVTVAAGVGLWNGIGPEFGLGPARGTVDRGATAVSCGAFALLFLLGFVVGGE